MKKLILSAVAICALAMSEATQAVSYNQTRTYIAGTGGNPNDGWTLDSGGITEVALRAKNRNNGDVSNVNGVYSFANAPATRGLFNYEFHVAVGVGNNLNSVDFYLGVDRDASAAVDMVFVDPLTYWNDNSYGILSTPAAGGTEGPASSYAGLNIIAQNSQNITFGDYPTGPGLALENNATYDYVLFAVADGAGVNGARLSSTAIQVIVGQGGAAVPDGGTTGFMLVTAAGTLIGFRKFKK